MHWTWDPNEDRTNRQPHCLSFETAMLVFDDPFAAIQEEPYPYEQRWRNLGMVGPIVLLEIDTWPKLDPRTGVEWNGLSVPAGRPGMKGALMKNENRELTDTQRAELAVLAALPDDQIDTSDVTEVLDWSDARRGVLYRPVKQQVTLRLDADLVAWFKKRVDHGRGYQTAINQALREYVQGKKNGDAS